MKVIIVSARGEKRFDGPSYEVAKKRKEKAVRNMTFSDPVVQIMDRRTIKWQMDLA